MRESRNIVFDTNVWVTYFLKNKTSEFFVMKANAGFEIFTCQEQIEELKDVLNRRKIEKQLSHTVDECLNIFELTTTSITICKKFSSCRDPKDNYLFDLAIQSNADYLVSGDRDVRETEIENVEVVSLTKFKEILRNKNRG